MDFPDLHGLTAQMNLLVGTLILEFKYEMIRYVSSYLRQIFFPFF